MVVVPITDIAIKEQPSVEQMPLPVKRVGPTSNSVANPISLVKADDHETAHCLRNRASGALVANTIIVQQGSRAAHSLGIAALVIGVLSIFVCWIPFVGIAVSGIGLLLGLGGLFLAIVRRGSGIGFAIAGTCLSVLSLVPYLILTTALGSAFKVGSNAVANREQANQNRVLDPEGAKSKPEANRDELSPTQGKESEKPTKNEADWPDASKGGTQQMDVRVQLESVEIDFVRGKQFDAFTSKEKLLKITLRIENTNPSRKVDFEGWGASRTFLADDAPRLTDNFGNRYKRINFGLGARVDGQVQSESVYPGKAVTDLLVFEVPLETVEYLRLELPGKNFKGSGMLRLQIPKVMLEPRRLTDGKSVRKGVAVYDAFQEPLRSRYIKDWEVELESLKKALKEDEQRLSSAKTAADRKKYSNHVKAYKERLATHEQNNPPYFVAKP